MNVVMGAGVAIAVAFAVMGLRGGVTLNNAGVRKCYSIAMAGACLASGAFFYQHFEALAR